MLSDQDWILHHYLEGHKVPTITTLFREEGVKASYLGISKFLANLEETGSFGRRIGSGKPSIITAEMKKLIEDQTHSGDETMEYQLNKCLQARVTVSLLAQFCSVARHLGCRSESAPILRAHSPFE